MEEWRVIYKDMASLKECSAKFKDLKAPNKKMHHEFTSLAHEKKGECTLYLPK